MHHQSTPPAPRRRKPAPSTPKGEGPPVFIYALCDPRNGQTRYLGRSMHVLTRSRQHRARVIPGHGCSPALAAWLAELHGLGIAPLVEVLDVVPEASAVLSEAAYSGVYRAASAPLLNQLSIRLAAAALRLGGPGVGYEAAMLRLTPQAIAQAAKAGCTPATLIQRCMRQALEQAGLAIEERRRSED